jgi:hypothetical protein
MSDTTGVNGVAGKIEGGGREAIGMGFGIGGGVLLLIVLLIIGIIVGIAFIVKKVNDSKAGGTATDVYSELRHD